MTRISAAENHIIEMNPDSWRLITVSETGLETPIFEAKPGEPLRYSTEFSGSRRLPNTGELPLNFVWQIILGWSNEDESWHLGLLLARDLADARGSRWCQIAYWPDPDTNVFNGLAQDAAQGLAQTITRPFNLIPARKPKVAELPLPDLPTEIGLWRLERTGEHGIQMIRSPRWVASRLMRMAWYVFWIVVYLILSIATLNTELALPNSGTMLPNPELLPYLGLAAAGVLFLMTLYLLYEILTRPNRILISDAERNITALHGEAARWSMDSKDLQSVYVTQVINKRGAKRTIYHGEINLHLGSGDFHRIVQQSQHEEDVAAYSANGTNPEEAIYPLSSGQIMSELQAAGLHISKALGGLPVWYDQRTR